MFCSLSPLPVSDRLKETKAVSPALSRAVAVSNLLHRSTAYKVSYFNFQPVVILV